MSTLVCLSSVLTFGPACLKDQRRLAAQHYCWCAQKNVTKDTQLFVFCLSLPSYLSCICPTNVVWSSTPIDTWLPPAAAFLNMLCSLKYGIYIFFGAWQFIAIFFTYFLVPETRGVPIEEVSLVTSCSHWQPRIVVACCSICSLPCHTGQGTATLHCQQGGIRCKASQAAECSIGPWRETLFV